MPADRETRATREDEEGLERLRAVVRANPRSTTFVALAHALCDAGLDDEAEEVSRRGLGQHPHLVTGQVALGRALFQRGRVREAQERLVEAAKNSPDNGDVFRWLGEVVLRRGEKARARVLLEYAEELLPSDARVGELLTEAGGAPQPRQTRPKTDFEDTRVSKNARALAERMQEEPPPRALHTPKNGSRTSPAEDAVTAEFEPRPPGSKPDLPEAANKETKTPSPIRPRTGSAARPDGSPSLAARAKALPRALKDAWDRGGRPVRIGAIALIVLLLVGSAWLLRPARQSEPAPFTAKWSAGEGAGEKRLVAAVDMTAAIAAGSLDGLGSVRVLGKRLAEAEPADPDQLAAAAFASALLANDYGVPGNGDALELAAIAARAPALPYRTGLIEASRALAALSNGRLTDAEAAAKRAVAAAPDSSEARLAEGRVHLRAGALAEAEAALTKAVSRTPILTAAALDLATTRIDVGEAAGALEVLTPLLGRHDDLRARLLVREAERQLGKTTNAKGLRERCREEGRASPILRTSCAADSAVTERLEGDRAGALRAARNATAGAGRNPRALAMGALVLANLGEGDTAADALRKIRDDSSSAFVPRLLAQLAVGLGRGELPDPAMKLPIATGPEARLLVARLAFARGGPTALKDYVVALAPPLLEQNPDLAAFAQLAEGAPPDDKLRTALEERAEKAGGIAAYVLGRHALTAGESKLAAQRLYRAATTSGETCEAARLLLTIDRKLRPPSVASDAKVAALARSHGCPSPLRP